MLRGWTVSVSRYAGPGRDGRPPRPRTPLLPGRFPASAAGGPAWSLRDKMLHCMNSWKNRRSFHGHFCATKFRTALKNGIRENATMSGPSLPPPEGIGISVGSPAPPAIRLLRHPQDELVFNGLECQPRLGCHVRQHSAEKCFLSLTAARSCAGLPPDFSPG